jgi:predicted HD superfamily hydrolase involved in NAD metabolism
LDTGVPLTRSIPHDATVFLSHHQALHTVGHSARVAAAARELAQHCGVNPAAAETAGWLHDISTVIPNENRIAYAEAWGIPVLPEERQVPLIIHQKLSAYLAEHRFCVTDRSILSAISCHTTLRAGASLLDKIVFIADKVKWDGAGDPPYAAGLQAALDGSVDGAARWFLSYLWERRSTLLVLHPWLEAAYREVVASSQTQ